MSDIFKINGRDLVKGLIVTVFSAVFAAVGSVIQNNGFSFTKENLMTIAAIAITSGLGYLSKQLITDDQGMIGGRF